MRRQFHHRRNAGLPDRFGAQVPPDGPGDLRGELIDRILARGDRLAVEVRQQGPGRLVRRDLCHSCGDRVLGRSHVRGVERARDGQRADPGLFRRVRGELGESVQSARGYDLAHRVAVGRDEVEFREPFEHGGFVATEHGGHSGRFERARLGHFRTADGGQGDRVVGGDDSGDGGGGEFADRVSGDDGIGLQRIGVDFGESE